MFKLSGASGIHIVCQTLIRRHKTVVVLLKLRCETFHTQTKLNFTVMLNECKRKKNRRLQCGA